MAENTAARIFVFYVDSTCITWRKMFKPTTTFLCLWSIESTLFWKQSHLERLKGVEAVSASGADFQTSLSRNEKTPHWHTVLHKHSLLCSCFYPVCLLRNLECFQISLQSLSISSIDLSGSIKSPNLQRKRAHYNLNKKQKNEDIGSGFHHYLLLFEI